MKSAQIYWMGKPLKKVYPHATRWQVIKWKAGRLARKAVIASMYIAAIVGMLLGAYFYGQFSNRDTVSYVAAQTVATAPTSFPVLDRIAKAESGDHQFAANGQVTIHINSNNTVDLGEYQINSVWFALATKLGYDLTKESDNRAFAIFLFTNYGSSPWNSSCNGPKGWCNQK